MAIARTLATSPKVLLCDEATSALDPKTTRDILRLIQDINRRLGITVSSMVPKARPSMLRVSAPRMLAFTPHSMASVAMRGW